MWWPGCCLMALNKCEHVQSNMGVSLKIGLTEIFFGVAMMHVWRVAQRLYISEMSQLTTSSSYTQARHTQKHCKLKCTKASKKDGLEIVFGWPQHLTQIEQTRNSEWTPSAHKEMRTLSTCYQNLLTCYLWIYTLQSCQRWEPENHQPQRSFHTHSAPIALLITHIICSIS